MMSYLQGMCWQVLWSFRNWALMCSCEMMWWYRANHRWFSSVQAQVLRRVFDFLLSKCKKHCWSFCWIHSSCWFCEGSWLPGSFELELESLSSHAKDQSFLRIKLSKYFIPLGLVLFLELLKPLRFLISSQSFPKFECFILNFLSRIDSQGLLLRSSSWALRNSSKDYAILRKAGAQYQQSKEWEVYQRSSCHSDCSLAHQDLCLLLCPLQFFWGSLNSPSPCFPFAHFQRCLPLGGSFCNQSGGSDTSCHRLW